MEPSILGVILDSSVLIEAEPQHLDVTRFLKHIATQIGEREAALCSISVAELAHGIHRANTPERRQARRAFLDDLKATVPVYPHYCRNGGTRRQNQCRIFTTRGRDPVR
jgi:predicted nucleic acid-binding protein